MKSNFDFLNRYWPALAQIGATAETYVYSDPNACIYKLGMFAERLVQEILAFEHIAEPAVDNTHANRIRILKRAGLLPHEIDNTLYVLRKTRNSAVHIGTDSVDEAKTLLSLTYNLAVWFMETYGDWGYIAPEFVMPSDHARRFGIRYCRAGKENRGIDEATGCGQDRRFGQNAEGARKAVRICLRYDELE